MKKILSLLFLSASLPLMAQQSIDEALSLIEQHNTTLIALRQTAEAEKLDNRTDIGLPDPEVEYGFLWGKPSAIGNRHDLSISQTFDAATLSGLKHKVANLKNEGVEIQYRAERMALLLRAQQLLMDLTCSNALIKALQSRLYYASKIVTAEDRKLQQGEGTKLDFNNARLNHTKALAAIAQAEAERADILAELSLLNGGEELDFTLTSFPDDALPIDFNAWYADVEGRLPDLLQAQNDLLLSRKQVALSRSECLPALTLGFMSEKTDEEHFRGITAGISIPLWSGRRKIRQARAEALAAEARQLDAVTQHYGQLRALYNRAMRLQSTAQLYRQALDESNNTQLLNKALDAGEISLIDYISEIGLYYDLLDEALKAERDYHKTLAELLAVEL